MIVLFPWIREKTHLGEKTIYTEVVLVIFNHYSIFLKSCQGFLHN